MLPQSTSVGETSFEVAIPSQARRDLSREGVETRRAAPKPRMARTSKSDFGGRELVKG
jgi:hypothetical protein